MTSKRDIERRLEKLDNLDDEEPPVEWMKNVPRELWGDPLEAWKYYITAGESHPDLGDENTW